MSEPIEVCVCKDEKAAQAFVEFINSLKNPAFWGEGKLTDLKVVENNRKEDKDRFPFKIVLDHQIKGKDEARYVIRYAGKFTDMWVGFFAAYKTQSTRIAAAVAALSTPDAVDAVKWAMEGEGITSEECDMGIAITKALAILEGREVLKDV